MSVYYFYSKIIYAAINIIFGVTDMATYKTTLKNQWENAYGILILLIIFIGFVCYDFYKDETEDQLILILIFGFAFLMQLIPLIIIHLNYYRTNKNDTLILNDNNFDITFINLGKEVQYNIQDIDCIEKHKSLASKRKDIPFLVWDSYNHSIITFTDGTKIIVTCLMTGGELILPIPTEKIKVRAALFRLVRGHSLQLTS
jgi:hypothetical protein